MAVFNLRMFRSICFWLSQIAFFQCKKLKEVEVYDGLKEIGQRAFYFTALEMINLPQSVTSLGNNAFEGCQQLKFVISHATTVPAIGSDAFDNNFKTGRKLMYPASADYSSWVSYFDTSSVLP